jgi:formate hydrogenlyase subunit 6/NADH:ubiquinone oxidoreductase subunit I
MMEQYKLLRQDIQKLISDMLKLNFVVVSQSANGKNYKAASKAEEVCIDPAVQPTDISVKEFFFPGNDTLFYYKKDIDDVSITDVKLPESKVVIFGAKPCDAASIPVLSKVFNWDYKDDFFNTRVDSTVIIGLACRYKDEHCFCASVGLSPDSTKGSDVFLTPFNDNEYILQVVTEKGKEFCSHFPIIFMSAFDGEVKPASTDEAGSSRFDYAKVKQWLDTGFNDEFWNKAGELCLGCAKCAYACPTCHCFDIVDESCSFSCGRRVKNWDSCQFGLFTKHASGHNPRNNQEKRYRQRIMHKFKYYNDRFDEILCTGCGRCSRGCPAGICISEILTGIDSIAETRI